MKAAAVLFARHSATCSVACWHGAHSACEISYSCTLRLDHWIADGMAVSLAKMPQSPCPAALHILYQCNPCAVLQLHRPQNGRPPAHQLMQRPASWACTAWLLMSPQQKQLWRSVGWLSKVRFAPAGFQELATRGLGCPERAICNGDAMVNEAVVDHNR